MMLYGAQQWGSDFWPVHYYEAHWYAELETGEIRLTPDGSKCSVYEVHLHTSIESNTTFTEPIDAIVQIKGVGDSSWTTGGDDNGTISVTPSTCVGTGTAWSNTIGYGDGSTVTFTTPAPAEKSRVYVNDVLQTVNVEYSITGTKQITFYPAPTDSYSVKTYWTGQPRVLGFVVAGGYIQTTYGLHRIITVNTATKLSLDWYPPTTVSGRHLPAQQVSTGESEKVDIQIHCIKNGWKEVVYIILRHNFIFSNPGPFRKQDTSSLCVPDVSTPLLFLMAIARLPHPFLNNLF